ncbi:MerR family transcriptional regulator [Streptomyces sp. WAC04114]|uniref:MerR family transcriptional regulator n=1 Tax=Streptomyces sp. WAC04114 TaxID=2867961 RepID=UPI001C8B0E0F|nr:MerR family transcriptional regulator [Streptomyces sp. WAC04114]MBX9362063.1 MerR family transcriptional regulator [Streptomyces sp. WAC04114]
MFVFPQCVLVAGVSRSTVDFDISVKVKWSADEEERVMKISEAAQKTGTPARMLRYYEQQGLIESSRSTNGYRDYSEDQVEHARHVRALVEAGLSTRMIKIVLDIEAPSNQDAAGACTQTLAKELAHELRVVENRIVCLEKSRDAVIDYLRRTGHADLLTSA